MRTIIRSRPVAALAVLITLAACGRRDADPVADTTMAVTPPPAAAPSVTTIQVGKHLGPDRRVSDTASVFGPRDTLYVSVVTENAGPTARLTARWKFQDGQTVDSTSQTVAPSSGAAGTMSVTEFHAVKPDGWPVGTYTVDLWLDNTPVGSRQIEVRR
jgi:hypothetical protein